MKTTLLVLAAIVLVVMNAAAFLLMGIDKKRAKRGEWRIKEKTLFLVTALFGGLGGTLGMFLLRHKTKHWYFRLGFPALLIVQAALLVAAAVLLL
ncbi:MAG: DUF1294 domain-containing protein [Clostridiales bacterium]|nr:DUF1294 domain-containing protein [Clostridiales bacterium]